MRLRGDQFAALMVAERDAELRGASPVEVVSWADFENRKTPAVELIARDSEGLVAVEHTVIESLPNQLAARAALFSMFPLGGVKIDELPTADQYRLMVDLEALPRVPRAERPLALPAAEDWVRQTLPDVPWPHVPGYPTFVRGSIDRPRLELSLERWTADIGLVGPLARVIQVTYWRPAKLELKRAVRLGRTLRTKVPKLLAAATGARTLLVLEDRDMSMSAPAWVSQAMAHAASGLELPNVIYLLNVTTGSPVLVPVYADGRWWHEASTGWMTFSDRRSAEFATYRL